MTHLDQTHVPISLTRVSISIVTIALYDTFGPDTCAQTHVPISVTRVIISTFTIALYDPLDPDTCAYIINQNEYLYDYYSIV